MLNYYVLLIFGPILVLVGILGFVIPKDKGLTSGAPAYNIFHIVFGSMGLLIALTDNDLWIRAFNIGFGLIDLYQLAANYLNLSPKSYFQWKKADDFLHLVIGLLLVFVGVFF
jgi:hypothetical protein